MQEVNEKLLEVVDRIREKYCVYKRGAYFFVYETLAYAANKLQLPENAHIGAKEIIQGMKSFAIESFGPMAKEVLNNWGIMECKDLGAIVDQLVEFGVLRKSESDSIDDFVRHQFDFSKEFQI